MRRRLPPLATVLEMAGNWATIMREEDVSHQRAILNELVDKVVIRRVGYRTYAVEIAWSQVGDRLHMLRSN